MLYANPACKLLVDCLHIKDQQRQKEMSYYLKKKKLSVKQLLYLQGDKGTSGEDGFPGEPVRDFFKH